VTRGVGKTTGSLICPFALDCVPVHSNPGEEPQGDGDGARRAPAVRVARAEPRPERLENRRLDRLDRLAAVHDHERSRLGGGQSQESVAHSAMELEVGALLEAGDLVRLLARQTLLGGPDRSALSGPGGGRPPRSAPANAALERLAGTEALIGESRVAEAVADDDFTALESRLDDLGRELGSSGVEEQRIGRRHGRRLGSVEQDPADRLAQGRPARLTSHHASQGRTRSSELPAAGPAWTCRSPSGPRGQEEAASGAAVEVHSTSLAEPRRSKRARAGARPTVVAAPSQRAGPRPNSRVQPDPAVGLASTRARDQVRALCHLMLQPADVSVLGRSSTGSMLWITIRSPPRPRGGLPPEGRLRARRSKSGSPPSGRWCCS